MRTTYIVNSDEVYYNCSNNTKSRGTEPEFSEVLISIPSSLLWKVSRISVVIDMCIKNLIWPTSQCSEHNCSGVDLSHPTAI